MRPHTYFATMTYQKALLLKVLLVMKLFPKITQSDPYEVLSSRNQNNNQQFLVKP